MDILENLVTAITSQTGLTMIILNSTILTFLMFLVIIKPVWLKGHRRFVNFLIGFLAMFNIVAALLMLPDILLK